MSKITRKNKNFSFQCLDVKISVNSNRKDLLEKLKKKMPEIFPVKWSEVSVEQIPHQFQILKDSRTGEISVFKEEETIYQGRELARAFDLLISRLRLTVAEFAGRLVFLHAGVVGWQGKAIIIPGKSFAGKTTLVAELAKNGCQYFSDEYAMLDKDGMVHPFPKKLSLRGIVDDYTQVDFAVEKLGGRRAKKPLPVGWILVAEYKKHKKNKAKLQEISPGEGIMACIANSISIRQNPKFVIEVLNKALSQTGVLKTVRGEASKFVKTFLDFLEKSSQ